MCEQQYAEHIVIAYGFSSVPLPGAPSSERPPAIWRAGRVPDHVSV